MVNRCVCMDCRFSEVLRRHDEGQSLDEIVDETGCGTVCGMCQPYIKLSILTNRSELDPGSVDASKDQIAEVDDPDGW